MRRRVLNADFTHRFVPGSPDAVTLLLLHGTGGDENDLLPLGRALSSSAGLLSPRGKVSEHGAARWFRRISEGVFDQDDLRRRTEELAGFIESAAERYELKRDRIVAVGFSNGANIAASLLLRYPGMLRGAMLLSPMVPFEPADLADLRGTNVFIGAGRVDPMVPSDETTRLADLLRRAGADVTVHWEPGGHGVTQAEVEAARRWLVGWIDAGWIDRRPVGGDA